MADQKITDLTAVVTPDNADLVVAVQDVATTPVTKKMTWTVIKAFLKTYFDALYHIAGGTDVPVADGGTGRSSHTAYAPLCGGTTTTGAQQSVASIGTSGQVFTSNGAGALPSFQDPVAATDFASAAETTTGTSSTKAVTPDGLAGSDYGKSIVEFILLPNSTATSVGDGAGDFYFTIPSEINGWNIVDVAASVATAGTTGTTDIQIHNVTSAADVLSTKITIDSGETSSYTAATPPVIDTSEDDVATGDQIRVDVDAISTTPASGLSVKLTFQLP